MTLNISSRSEPLQSRVYTPNLSWLRWHRCWSACKCTLVTLGRDWATLPVFLKQHGGADALRCYAALKLFTERIASDPQPFTRAGIVLEHLQRYEQAAEFYLYTVASFDASHPAVIEARTLASTALQRLGAAHFAAGRLARPVRGG